MAATERLIVPDSLGARVRAARLERGMSQAELAGSELTKGFISQLENGLVRPSIRSLQVIANRLGKSLDYFLGDEPLSIQKRVEFFSLAAQAAFERREWTELGDVAAEALRLELEPKVRARFVRWKAQALLGLGQNEEVFAATEEVFRLIVEDDDPALFAVVLHLQGAAYGAIGQNATALEVIERALRVLDKYEVLDVFVRTRILLALGTIYRRLNRTARAVHLYESALSLANRSSDLRSVARALMGVAATLYDSGELDGAITNYRKALELFRRISDQEFELEALQSLAAVRYELGEIEQAEEYARLSRERASAIGNERYAAVAQIELARVALKRGEPKKALDLALWAAQALEKLADRRQHAFALRVAGAAHHALGQHGESDRRYAEAIEEEKAIQLFPEMSNSAAEYAQKLRERGEYERAFEYLEMARRHAVAPAPAAS